MCPRIEELSVEERQKMWPEVRPLRDKHIRNCRLVENRIKLLEFLPKKAVCAELGVLEGDFSEKILSVTQPSKLHLIDSDQAVVEKALKRFQNEIQRGVVSVIRADSSEAVRAMPDGYLDWIYIDADHTYEGVKRDLEAAHLKVKDDGLIIVDDYVFFGATDFKKYGVIEAVNEFCHDRNYEMVFFAFHGRMYNDVVLKRLR